MKFLLKPLNKLQITQTFGENRACIDKATGTKTITCDGLNPPDGYKSVYSRMKGHNGTDFRAKRYTSIYASQDGWVEEYVADDDRGLGLGIVTDRTFFCRETNSETHFKIRYWHNYINLVKKGDKVKIGQLIALVDNTGYSSGDHLHFELKPVTIKKGRVKNTLQNNGYYGAVDPMPYMLDVNASAFQKVTGWVNRLVVALKMV